MSAGQDVAKYNRSQPAGVAPPLFNAMSSGGIMDIDRANGPGASVHWPYLAAAAVLTTFAPAKLTPLFGKKNVGDVLAMLTQYAEPVLFGPARGQWRLSDNVRQQVPGTRSFPVID